MHVYLNVDRFLLVSNVFSKYFSSSKKKWGHKYRMSRSYINNNNENKFNNKQKGGSHKKKLKIGKRETFIIAKNVT